MKAGFGRASLTPEVGRGTGGYSICAPFGQGWWGRLTASALVLIDGDHRVALVAIDLHAGSRWVAERAARILGWKKHEILLAGTHTHLGP
ncbi:MAG: hypothetical protein KC621_05675, partial [Myxococcales bacterium]|nr:hypothetical protein [Myxococcales bacterium]